MLAVSGAGSLHRGRSEASGVAHPCPRRHSRRFLEAISAGHRSRVWNPFEGKCAAAVPAADTAAVDLDLDERPTVWVGHEGSWARAGSHRQGAAISAAPACNTRRRSRDCAMFVGLQWYRYHCSTGIPSGGAV